MFIKFGWQGFKRGYLNSTHLQVCPLMVNTCEGEVKVLMRKVEPLFVVDSGSDFKSWKCSKRETGLGELMQLPHGEQCVLVLMRKPVGTIFLDQHF